MRRKIRGGLRTAWLLSVLYLLVSAVIFAAQPAFGTQIAGFVAAVSTFLLILHGITGVLDD